jgi:FMN phosphatase YigB (HAD superfamily)
MQKAVVFDFGNVVGFFDHNKALARLAPYTTWPAKRIFDEVYEPFEDDIETGRIGTAEYLRLFMTRCELRCDADFLLAVCGDIFTPNPAICDLIPRLNGRCRIILGSNTNALHADWFQRQFADVLAHFHHQVLSFAIGVRKPKAEFFRECVRRAEREPGDCLFVDDLAANIAGAEAVGMRGLLYHPRVDIISELAQFGVRVDG